MNERLEVDFKGERLKGLLIKEDKNFLTLKLYDGYNANLSKDEIKEISREKVNVKTVEPKVKKTDKKLPKIIILHTGGTIASKVDYKTGGVISRFSPEELLEIYPELADIANIEAKLIHNMWSGDMNFSHYNLMMDAIKKAIDEKPVGIILTQGTDTLHYTTAALQYAIDNLSIPIVLVAAQRSSDRPSSDSFLNLRAAMNFIIENDKKKNKFLRVGACMHSSISDKDFILHDGINLKKTHSSRRDTFKQINYKPYATISEKGKVEVIRSELESEVSKSKVEFTKFDPKLKVGFFKAHPNTYPEEIKALSIYDAVVIEGTGLGHVSVDEIDEYTKMHPLNLKALTELNKKTKLIMGLQAGEGAVNLNVYSYGREIQANTNMLGQFMNLIPETLFIRAAYILSKDKKNFEKIWDENLEGFDSRTVDLDSDF